MSGDEHRESRSSWRCSSCGEPWPCESARAQIAADLASADQGNRSMPTEVIERFLRWGHC